MAHWVVARFLRSAPKAFLKQAVNGLLSIVTDCLFFARWKQRVDLNTSRVGFFVGRNDVRSFGVTRHVEFLTRPRLGGCRDRSEVVRHHLLNRGFVEIPDRDHGHQIRTIPIEIELLQSFCFSF